MSYDRRDFLFIGRITHMLNIFVFSCTSALWRRATRAVPTSSIIDVHFLAFPITFWSVEITEVNKKEFVLLHLIRPVRYGRNSGVRWSLCLQKRRETCWNPHHHLAFYYQCRIMKSDWMRKHLQRCNYPDVFGVFDILTHKVIPIVCNDYNVISGVNLLIFDDWHFTLQW